MRGVLVALALVFVAAAAAPARADMRLQSAVRPVLATTAYAIQQPDKDVKVDINVNHGGGRWYRSPVWIAIFVLAGVVLLILIVLAFKGTGTGGGTTIIRE